MAYYMGIDYGSKRIGTALSDERGEFAFPHSVVLNNGNEVEEIASIIEEKGVERVVVGESKDFKGELNPIMKDVKDFIARLRERTKKNIILEPEFLSSVQAERIQGKHDKIDASAAAIILQSYIDKQK